MKKNTTIIATLIALAAIFITGCTTVTTTDPFGDPVTKQVPDIERIAAVTQETTAFAVATLLAEKPETEAPLSKTLSELTVLASQDAITPSQILTILNKLPVKQFSSPNGVLAFSAAKIILASAGWSNIDIVKLNELKPIVEALRQGLINAGVVE